MLLIVIFFCIEQQGKNEFKELTLFNKLVECLNKQHGHVISDYVKNQKIFENRISSSQILKLKKLIKHILTKYDPRNISDNKYVSLYEDAVKLGLEFKIDLTSFRGKILSLLSFTYEYQTILDAVQNPTEKEIQSFFNWYTDDLNEEFKINHINNFIDFCGKFNLKEAEGFLLKIIHDEKINHYSRNNAISLVFSWKAKPISFFKKIFIKYSTEKKWSPHYCIAIYVNALLLEAQDENAFDWRINEIFNFRYKIRGNFSGVRSVQPEEGFGKPLNNISSSQLYPKILSLLERSLKCLEEDAMYYRFVESEIWDFIVKYFRTLRKNKHEHNKYLTDLKFIVDKNNHIPDANAFYFYIKKIKNEFISFLGEPEPFPNCIQKYLLIKQKQYIDIAYPSELFQLVQGVINNELQQWVNEGFYGFIKDLKAPKGSKVEKEKIIQKTIVTQLENFLLKKGLRASDINEVFPEFYREVEIPDGKKVDLIITYGTIGKVMIEIKRAGNSELSSGQLEDYKNETFLPYMNQTNCEFGIYLIFRDNEKEPVDFEAQILRVKKIYSEFSNIRIIGIDCVK